MRKWKWILLILILGCAAWLVSRAEVSKDKWREIARQVEAQKAESEGLLVAEQASVARLKAEVSGLESQIETLEDRLGIEVEPELVIRRETNPINVENSRLLGEMRRVLSDKNSEIDALNDRIREMNRDLGLRCPECPTFDDLLPGSEGMFQFKIGDLSAAVRSEAGNVFLVGQAELFLTEPESLAGSLGVAEYDTNVSDLFAQKGDSSSPPRWYLGAHVKLWDDESISSYDYRTYRTVTEIVSISSVRGYAGRIWFPRKRHQIRTGVFAEQAGGGIDMSISF